MKHKHYDAIVAWAEEAARQRRSVVKYRNYLYRLTEGQYVVSTAQADFKSEGMVGFVRWIGEWQEVEI